MISNGFSKFIKRVERKAKPLPPPAVKMTADMEYFRLDEASTIGSHSWTTTNTWTSSHHGDSYW